jgi:hypothetical protein
VLLCIGLGYGDVLRIGDSDVFGAEVNAASKLGEDHARPYEIMVTGGGEAGGKRRQGDQVQPHQGRAAGRRVGLQAEVRMSRRVLILGAAGRDFHNFNLVYRDDPAVEVVAFTAAQIPGIAGRRYPPELAGPRYPEGILILDEAELERSCREQRIDEVVFAYSDVPHAQVMHLASKALAAGADFTLLGPARTQIRPACR